MSKAVLLSIKPQWCGLIAGGQKTIEVRKTCPQLKTPFKCYIYCTYGRGLIEHNDSCYPNMLLALKVSKNATWGNCCNGKVIGEFACREVEEYHADDWQYGTYDVGDDEVLQTCLDGGLLWEYGKGQTLYGWHISNLVIYDKPKEPSEFITPSKFGCVNEGKCRGCVHLDRGNGYSVEDDCTAWFSTDDYKPLRKAPQSWCYVEEMEDEK